MLSRLVGSCNHIQHFDLRGFKGRVFFSTDIHGHFHLLHENLREVAFDSTKDILFLGGDNTDRHMDSKYILDYLCEPWVYSIRGNHCEMLIDAYENPQCKQAYQMLYCNGGEWFYDISKAQQKAIYEVFKTLPLAFEIQTDQELVGIVHAEVPGGDWNYFKEITKAELDWNGRAIAQWARTKYDRQDSTPVKNIDLVLAGHTPTKSGKVETLGNVRYCDLGSFFRNKLAFIQIH